MNPTASNGAAERLIQAPAEDVTLDGALCIPEGARGIALVIESETQSQASDALARRLNAQGLATLRIGLLTPEEAAGRSGGDVAAALGLSRLAGRLERVTDWLAFYQDTNQLLAGYYATGAGAATTLIAAAERPRLVGALVVRDDGAELPAEVTGAVLARVQSPALLLAPADAAGEVARGWLERIPVERRVETLPASPTGQEAQAELARHAGAWFARWLLAPRAARPNLPDGVASEASEGIYDAEYSPDAL